MGKPDFPRIRDLAVIGDRRTAALITTDGAVVWYCPGRFDQPSLFAALLDPKRGGTWALNLPADATFVHRRYLEDSGVLETTLSTSKGEFQITDWMSIGDRTPPGICRRFSPAPTEITLTLAAAPNYAQRSAHPRYRGQAVQIDQHYYLYASHSLQIVGEQVSLVIPAREPGWAGLFDQPLALPPDAPQIETWLQTTLNSWHQITSHTTYHGPYEQEVAASMRALRLLTFEDNGGIIAAPTTSLPEVVGGQRNYDYRYVWLRDTGMIVSALTRAGSDGTEERRFLEFICGYERDSAKLPLLPFSTLDGEIAPEEKPVNLTGYDHSQPVVVGNNAKAQLQLDAYGNVLLAAKLIYNRFDTREHWPLIERIANFLVEHWREPDHGLWEERDQRQYTSSKVIVACGLKFISDRAETAAQAQRWRAAEQDIRQFVAQECLNSEGAYAAVAGGEAVDVSAALFPVWAYTAPDTPEMLATIKVLERDYATGHLYRRHLEQFDSRTEGAFLAGTFWVAQYWVMRQDFQRAHSILDAALQYANDLYLFAEEADPHTGEMLGNFPQTFVHAAFIGAVIDLRDALKHA